MTITRWQMDFEVADLADDLVRLDGTWLGATTKVICKAGDYQVWHTPAHKGFAGQGRQDSKPGIYRLVQLHTFSGKQYAQVLVWKESSVDTWRELKRTMIATCQRMGQPTITPA